MLKDKIIWVTGASKGIGGAICNLAAEHNAQVYNSSRSDHPNKIVKNINADFSNVKDITNAYKQIIGKHKNIDILINNAGVSHFKEMKDISLDEFQQMCNVNFRGTFWATNLALKTMLEHKSGIIINILSSAVYKTFTFSSVYAATKAAIRAMSNSLREEVRKDGIKIINIYPGATKTDIWAEDMRTEHGKVMSTPMEVAETVINAIELTYQNKGTMIEEIHMKPQNGDL